MTMMVMLMVSVFDAPSHVIPLSLYTIRCRRDGSELFQPPSSSGSHSSSHHLIIISSCHFITPSSFYHVTSSCLMSPTGSSMKYLMAFKRSYVRRSNGKLSAAINLHHHHHHHHLDHSHHPRHHYHHRHHTITNIVTIIITIFIIVFIMYNILITMMMTGEFRGFLNYLYRSDVFPMTYTIADAYVKSSFNRHTEVVESCSM